METKNSHPFISGNLIDLANTLDSRYGAGLPFQVSDDQMLELNKFLIAQSDFSVRKFTPMYQSPFNSLVRDFEKLFDRQMDSIEFYKLSEDIAKQTLLYHLTGIKNPKRKKVVVVCILRAGYLFRKPAMEISGVDKVIYIKASRGHKLEYTIKELESCLLKNHVSEDCIYIFADPMLATFGTQICLIERFKELGVEESEISIVGLNNTPEGPLRLWYRFPEIGKITSAYMSDFLSDTWYIQKLRDGKILMMGDAGDRINKSLLENGVELVGQEGSNEYKSLLTKGEYVF